MQNIMLSLCLSVDRPPSDCGCGCFQDGAAVQLLDFRHNRDFSTLKQVCDFDLMIVHMFIPELSTWHYNRRYTHLEKGYDRADAGMRNYDIRCMTRLFKLFRAELRKGRAREALSFRRSELPNCSTICKSR